MSWATRVATTQQVLAAMNAPATCVIDALGREQHQGISPVSFGRPGHIPGSINLPYLELLNPDDGTFLPLDTLRAQRAAVGALDATHVITSCGGGIGATTIACACALVGRPDVVVYDGSMQAWCADPQRPVIGAAAAHHGAPT